MIEETYVSFETAKLLKEKGFNEDCYAYWDLTTETKTPKIGLSVSSKNWNYKWNPIQFPISAPTQAMAMKWLREVHNLQIQIAPITSRHKDWAFGIYKEFSPLTTELLSLPTYEEAVEAAIKYCLENLI